MSEDDATALEQEAAESLAAERDAFEARFPPEAFTGIAKALKIPEAGEPFTVARLAAARVLLPLQGRAEQRADAPGAD